MSGRLILVADTSDGILDTLREVLAATDYELLHAKDGQRAIDHLESPWSEIDLAIVELGLPGVDGLDVIWRLVRRRKGAKPIKIIAVSAMEVQPLLKQVVKELGVDAVVQIPIPREDWCPLISAVLRGEPSVFSQNTDLPSAIM